MKQEIYDKLSKYNTYLYTAKYADYIRALTNRQVEELIEIGNELGIHYTNNHCPKCMLDFMKKLAIPYFLHETKEITDNKSKDNEKPKRKNTRSTSKTR